MRTRILLFCGIVLAFCLWLLLHHASEQIKNTPQATKAVFTNHSLASQLLQPSIPEKRQITNSPTAPNASPTKKMPWPTTEEFSQQALAPWHTPIEFYGKIIDENSNPVAGASVQFRWATQTEDIAATTATTESGTDGLFSLHDKHGVNLTVWISKEGYYISHNDKWGFNYALGPDIISPDSLNPVIFHLRKKGIGENLVGVKQNYRVARDGTPLGIDLTTGKANSGGPGDFVVQCWTDDQGKRSGAKYDWRCLITVPGGGVVPTDEEFAFLAPENGYALTNEIAMPADRTNWTSDVDLKFYYRLADGRYGKMKFSMIAGGQHFCMIDSVLNPSGSRNLEPQ